jgi:hypothetical protein
MDNNPYCISIFNNVQMPSVNRELLSLLFCSSFPGHAMRKDPSGDLVRCLACGATQNILQRADLRICLAGDWTLAFIVIGCGFFDKDIPGTSHVMQNVSRQNLLTWAM